MDFLQDRLGTQLDLAEANASPPAETPPDLPKDVAVRSDDATRIAPPDLIVRHADLFTDPAERANLAADPAHAATLTRFREMADARWNLPAFDAAVRESQARRWVVYEALRNGAYFPWDHQPLRAASERYMRNHMDLNILEESKRFPRGE